MARKHKRKNASSSTSNAATTEENAGATTAVVTPDVKSPAKKRNRSTENSPSQQQPQDQQQQNKKKKQKLSNNKNDKNENKNDKQQQQKQKQDDKTTSTTNTTDESATSTSETSSTTTIVPLSSNTPEFSWSAFDHIIANEKHHHHNKNNHDSDDSDSDDDSDNDDEEAEDKHKNKILKAQQKKHNEQLIAERERELTLDNVLPESDNDFERLLAGSPNNSYLWIQYMAFKLANTDIEAARTIAERALKKIHYREDQEKFNIFAALMNLESKFGDEDSQRKVFNRAVQYCEAKDVYLQQAKIHEQNGDEVRVHETYQKMMKKFFKSRKPYEAYQQYLVQVRQYKKANEVLERCLKNLPKHKHLKAISKFALIHYKYGSIVDGHQIFEQLVSNYPKRTDVWSMYIDAELNAERVDQVRQLYERVVHLNLSTKKMQSFLKRYLRFEKEQQSEQGQEHVKQIARDFIAAKTSGN